MRPLDGAIRALGVIGWVIVYPIAMCLIWLWSHGAQAAYAGGPPRVVRDDYLIDTWETEHGLPENSATAMVQTADGYLWFGTFNGLVRFDGVRFEVFNPANTPQLPGRGIVNLHLDRAGRLWVSTLDGLVLRDEATWRRLGEGDGWTGGAVRAFVERGDGAVLASTFDGRFMEWSAGRWTELLAPPGKRVPSAMVAADVQGRWWVACPGAVSAWDGSGWTTVVHLPDGYEGFGCASARDGGVWVITAPLLRKYRGDVEVARLEIPDLPVGVWSIFEDSAGNVWVATHNAGVSRITPAGRHDRWDMNSGLAYNGVRFVFEDRERNLWVGTSGGGLTRFKTRRVRSYGVESGITERVVQSVWPLTDGSMLLGTYGHGPFKLADGTAERIHHQPARGSTSYVQSVLQDRTGRVWIGAYNQGLFLDDQSGTRQLPAAETGGDNVVALFEDSRGGVWVSGGMGVAVFESGGRSRTVECATGVPLADVCAFAEDSDGAILASNQRGVFRSTGSHFEELRTREGDPIADVLCLRPERGEVIWMGTQSAGLLRWNDGAVNRVDARVGFPAQSVRAIVVDDRGYWWMATTVGVVRAAAGDLSSAADGALPRIRCQVLGIEDGMPSVECTGAHQPVCAKDRSGRLWFATLKGVASIDPERFVTNEVPPSVWIEEVAYVTAPGRPDDSTNEREHRVHLGGPFTEPVVLPPGSRRVEVRYTAPSFSSPREVAFEVMIEGVDRAWQDAGQDRSVVYHDLTPGRYAFRVRARNDDGLVGEQGASLVLVMTPHFWQSWWFRSAAVLAATGCIAGAAWWAAHRRLHQRRRVAEQFRLVVEAAPNAIILVDDGGRITLVNSQAEREFGYQRAELIGQPVEVLIPERARSQHVALRHGYMANPAARAMGAGRELFGRRKDGSEIPIEIALNPVETPQGTGILASIVNISERQRTERELLRQRDELAHLSRVSVLGELSGSIAHELNQPLTAILSNAQAAQDLIECDPVDLGEVRDILFEIVEQDKRAGDVIRGLRSLLKKGETKHQSIDMVALVRDVLRLLHSDLIGHGVEIDVLASPTLPAIDGDRVQLQQVLLNLLLNACDTTAGLPSERRRLALTVGAEEGNVRVSVRDAGAGIAPEVCDRLFDPFLTTKANGMGLGLTVCRTIVESHGGRIWAENNETQGATFSFVIPAGKQGTSA